MAPPLWLLFVACPPSDPVDTGAVKDSEETGSPNDETGSDTDTGTPLGSLVWDPPASALTCAEGADAPLYDEALADAEIDRADVGFPASLWSAYADYGYVAGPFQLPWFEAVHHEPEYAACFIRQSGADWDHASAAAHPVATAVRALAVQAGLEPGGEPIQPSTTTLKDAIKALKDAAGGGEDSDRTLELPEDLATALVPVVLAMTEGLLARAEMDAASEPVARTRKLYADGAGLVLGGGGYLPDITEAAEVEAFAEWYTGESGPSRLLTPAAQIAFAIEEAELSRFAGGDTDWRFSTDAGDIVISPSTDDTHVLGETMVLFQLELGGSDRYEEGAGANTDDANPVSVTVDLGGNDHYGYALVGDSHDGEGMLVADEDGRVSSSGYWVSVSDEGRQGAGRYGIGLLFDLGGGTDTYASLRMSQGFGALGVGVLYDDAGDDTYAGEAGVQGAGIFGFGLLLDGGGNDHYSTWAFSQGFGYVGGAGALVDAAGDDIYWSDPGNAFGGTTLYYSPQLPGGEGNSSFTQGAGFGTRADAYSLWFSGGVGLLRDSSGDDAYTAGVFSQATGYWEGVGILADGAGNDSYDALYYMQGGSAHFAAAVFLDQGGNDNYGQSFDSYYMHTGAGHDFSLGLFLEDSGNDVYGYGGLAVGASNCQGVGIFVDRDGSDVYDARSTYSTGLGNHSGECATRTSQPSTGIFLDAGGDADTYLWTEGDVRLPADNHTFGIEWSATSDEHGGAVDGDSAPGF